MAEGYIGETTCSTYIRQRLHYVTIATSSGHNVYVELQMRRTNSYGGATYQYPSNSYININGDRYDWGWTSGSYPTIPAYNTDWITFASRTVHVSHTNAVSIGISGGNYNMGSYLNGDTSGTITLDAIYSNPATPSVTLKSKTYNSATFAVSISSYGIPSSTSGRYIEAAILGTNSYGSDPRRWAKATNTTSSNITVNNSSSTGSTALTITGNTKYWYGGYATNTQRTSSVVTGTFYTPCPPLSALSLSSQVYAAYNAVKATISFTRASDGGAETRTGKYRYSTDKGATYTSWASFGTVSNTTGTFDISGLPTDKTVILQVKLNTPNGGDSEVKQISFSTSTTHTAPNFSDFEYEDSCAATVALTGDDQIFIQGQSQPKVIIPAADAATANDGASISGYTASLNAESIQIAYSASAEVSGSFSANRPTASGTLALSVAANDSLSLAKSVSKNVSVIPWAAPVLNATATRTNNFENTTTIKINGTYSPMELNSSTLNTLTIAYRYKKTSASSWEQPTGADANGWVTVSPTISGSSFSVADFVLSLDNEYQWDIEVKAVDVFETTTKALTLAVGKPIFFISKNKKVSVNRKPTNYSADVDVEGKVYAEDSVLT